MKRTILIIILRTSINILCNAQYNPYYDANQYASGMLEAEETYKLNNIRFDEDAIRRNPAAWSQYQKYTADMRDTKRKSKIFSIVGFTGLTVGATALIPTYKSSNYDLDDARYKTNENWAIGLLTTGATALLVGAVGCYYYEWRMKESKKDFIFYLKTTNNGIGIVTIF